MLPPFCPKYLLKNRANFNRNKKEYNHTLKSGKRCISYSTCISDMFLENVMLQYFREETAPFLKIYLSIQKEKDEPKTEWGRGLRKGQVLESKSE